MKPLMRYHGAKWRLAPWIISHFPQHHCYVEPFGGSAAVLISKEPSANEVYNDLNNDVVNLFRILRDPMLTRKLIEMIELTPYSRSEFEDAYIVTVDPLESARRLLIRANMGFGSGGATLQTTGFRSCTKRAGQSLTRHWQSTAEALEAVAHRLRANVMIECRDANYIINAHARKETLFYLDPPYVMDTRKVNQDVYHHEMNDLEHEGLLKLVTEIACKDQGMFVISGYESEIYESYLSEWTKSTKQVVGSGQKGGVKRTEVLWISPNCEQQQTDLFDFEEISA